MKGTIDPGEAIFTAGSGLGGRVVSFFVSCWVGFAFGILAATVTWHDGVGVQLTDASQHWYFVPITWMFATAGGVFKWWGLPHLLILIIVGYRLILSEADVCLSVCFLFLMESWLWWAVEKYYFEFTPDSVFESTPHDAWHPMFFVLILLSVGTLWLAWRTWRKEHPSTEPEHLQINHEATDGSS